MPQTGSVLMPMASDSIEGHVNARGLGCHLEPRKFGWPALPIEAIVTSSPGLLPKTMSGSVVLPQSGSVLMFMAHSNTKVHTDVQG